MRTLMSLRRAVRAATPALALGTAAVTAVLAACSDSPTAPTRPAAGAAFSKSADKTAAKAAKDSVKAAKHTAKDDAQRMAEAALDTVATTWHTTAQDQEPGTDRPVTLTCSVDEQASVTQTIGKKGGVLTVGSSTLTIPAGALSQAQSITATVTKGAQGVRLDFAPHGLTFQHAVEFRVDYRGCDALAGLPLNVFYTDAAGGIVQVMPSAQAPAGQAVRALTDHFSGYLVSWGRH